jgi:hypothetical protein
MNKVWATAGVLIFGVWILAGCEKKKTVQAGSEGVTSSGEYKPRAAPEPGADVTRTPAEIKGELRSVNLNDKTMIVRVDNGMDQTFNWDENTTVRGMPSTGEADKMKSRSRKTTETVTNMTQLARRTGSDVSVQWRDDNDMKMATMIDVTTVMSPKKAPSRRRH